ncbi:MAG: DsbA family protein [Pseudomonadota bacterium]|nr:DsbA family protein [Pseudomonadota bacterium]
MNRCSLAFASATILLGGACSSEKPAEAKNSLEVAAAPVPAPNNGDWSTIVEKTPEGGFRMGNPNAKVKLIEYGSLTCHICAEFEEQGGRALVDNYVRKGLVSWEFRNFVRDPFDVAASLLARCAGEASFFGLTRNLFVDQNEWVGKIQAAGPAKLQALQSMLPAQQFSTIADLGGLNQYAAMRGVPRAKGQKCLANEAEINQLVQMNADATSTYSITGTPAFLINGRKVDETRWEALEPKIEEALAS